MQEMRVRAAKQLDYKAMRRFVMTEIFLQIFLGEQSVMEIFLICFERSVGEGFWNAGICGFCFVEIFWRLRNLKCCKSKTINSSSEQIVMEVSKMHESQRLNIEAARICTFATFSNRQLERFKDTFILLRNAKYLKFVAVKTESTKPSISA